MSYRPLTISVILMLASLGCSSMKRSDTARTGREQLLISNAVDQSLSKCDFGSFNGSKVFVDEKYLEGVDKAYVIGSIRHRLMLSGATLAAKPEEADVVLEMRSGGLGTDNADSYVGIPAIVLPGMLTLPEVRFWEKARQTGIAKIGIAAYDAKNHEMLGAGGVTAALSSDTNMFFMGIGPYEYGSAKREIDQTTPRYIGQPNQEVPSMIAFREASKHADPEPVQLTGDKSSPAEH